MGQGRDGEWQQWRAQRPPSRQVHLDTAAAGRSSAETLRVTAAHAEREAVVGAYVAEAEAAPVLDQGRAALAGLLGVPAAGLAFTESATAARDALLAAWPLPAGGTVAVAPSEWGPNLFAFSRRGLAVTELAAGADGTVDLEHLARLLADHPPALVHLTQVPSHRGLAEPVAAAAALCRAAGVPLWVDAAQALGHADTATGADAVYATSRKWLTGPRGVGLLGVAESWWDRLQVSASPHERSALPSGSSPVRLLESHDANVAGRVGLCAAARQHLAAGPARVRQRLAEVGQLTRQALAGLPGWEVAGPAGAAAITALRPAAGQDVPRVRARLLAEHGILTTAALPARAPRDMTGPLLRVSPHVDVTAGELGKLRDALA
ncbi:MAG: aminotransferase class V-fold PLP-dependent enzyme, partial [Actinobacteria bacterium]|nr:aminotransferase class V-fold PLP-dependent enzyme [Actinomycetota bacterium]